MVSDKIYELCQPILKDATLEEEDKTDKLEALLRKETPLEGRPLEDAILGVLWRYRDATVQQAPVSPPTKASQLRRGSPAPWQIPRTVTPAASPALASASPASSHGLVGGSGTASAVPFPRARSSAASPFASPRPSPRLVFASPIPHSPSLQQYEFSDPTGGASAADYGDYGSDTVDWLVGEDAPSRPTSSGAGSNFDSSLSGAAAAWVQPQQSEMTPFDMLRSILGETRSDEEIEAALEANQFDLSATTVALMGVPNSLEDQGGAMQADGQVLIGKNMLSQPIALGQSPGQAKSSTICKYWMATGNCLRADCRFQHEYGSTICRFWLMGNCLAGDNCVFSHDPSQLVSSLHLGPGNQDIELGPNGQPSFQVQDYDAFPQLASGGIGPWAQHPYQNGFPFARPGSSRGLTSESSAGGTSNFMNSSPRSYSSRPTSRHSSRAVTPSIPSVDDTDAFPTLGTVGVKSGSGSGSGKKHHGKRGHGHAHVAKENMPNSLADVVRMSPSPAPGLLRKGLVKTRSYGASRENSAAANAIPPPEHIPWLATGERANQAYLKARQEAFKHGGLRNKFLQSAAQAWNRNDARAAKALSLRGQSENESMRKAHREGARALYEERNKHLQASGGQQSEFYVDLHGLHPEEATEFLAQALRDHRGAPTAHPIYAITGTGHHSKGGKDKVGKAVRGWLAERGFAFREFSVPGDRGNVGGILGIDARTGRVMADGEDVREKDETEEKGRDTKVRLAKEVPTGPKAKS